MDKGILKNVSINFIGLILPTFVSLVTVPAYIHALGVERYGVVSLVWTLIGYFGILDLGMSMAAQNHISKALASGDAAESARVFWSAFWLNLGTGIAGGLLIYFGAFVYTAYFTKVSAAMQHEVYLALPWLALAIPLANVSWVFAGAINGAERFGVFNTNQTIGTFLFQLLPLGAAWWIAPNLQTVLAAAVVARLIAAVMLGHASIKVLGIRRIDPPQWGTAKGLFNFGGWMLIASMASMIADTLDRVMLGAGMGAKFVTYYTVPQNLVTRLNMLPNALVRTLFPRLSAVGRDHADTLARQSLEFLNGVFTPVGIVAIFALAPFLTLWVGADLAAHSAPVGRVLVISVWLVGQASVTRILIQSQVNPARAAFAGLVEMPFFVGALWFGIHHFGLIGAAVVVAVRALVDYGVLLYLSAIRMRAIVLDMLAHLAFLLASLLLAQAWSGLGESIGLCAVVLVLNLAWSLTMTPGCARSCATCSSVSMRGKPYESRSGGTRLELRHGRRGRGRRCRTAPHRSARSRERTRCVASAARRDRPRLARHVCGRRARARTDHRVLSRRGPVQPRRFPRRPRVRARQARDDFVHPEAAVRAHQVPQLPAADAARDRAARRVRLRPRDLQQPCGREGRADRPGPAAHQLRAFADPLCVGLAASVSGAIESHARAEVAARADDPALHPQLGHAHRERGGRLHRELRVHRAAHPQGVPPRRGGDLSAGGRRRLLAERREGRLLPDRVADGAVQEDRPDRRSVFAHAGAQARRDRRRPRDAEDPREGRPERRDHGLPAVRGAA
jgi:O-antigen/teichoic acid export membrane protein